MNNDLTAPTIAPTQSKRMAKEEHPSEKRIREARRILEPSPVGNRIPSWIGKRIRTAIKEGKLPKPDFAPSNFYLLQHALGELGRGWVDHHGSIKTENGLAFVSEPYGLGIRSLRELIRFCETLGLSFSIDSNSYHYPGATLRITITEPNTGPI